MDLHYLNYITAIAKLQNMSKAAALLHISQPTLSIYVKNLETELGTPLFIRSRGKMTLTAAGEAYVAACNKILDIKQELYTTLDELKAPQLKIGITTSNVAIASEILDQYHNAFPHINLLPMVIAAQDGDASLENNLIDFVLSPESLNPLFKKRSQVVYSLLQEYELVLVISSENPVYPALGDSLALTPQIIEQLNALPFISQSFGTSKAKYDLNVLSEFGIFPTRRIVLNDVKFMLQSVIQDNSYTLIPYSRFSDPRIRMISLPGSHPIRRFLKYSAERDLSSYDIEFIEMAKNYYQSKPFFYLE